MTESLFLLIIANCKLTDDEKITLALVNFLFAIHIMISDDPVEFDSKKEEPLTRRILKYFKIFEKEEFGNILLKEDIYLIFNKNRNYCGIINLSQKEYITAEKDLITLSECKKINEASDISNEERIKLLKTINVTENNQSKL